MLDPKQPIYTLTVEQVRELINEAIKETILSQQNAPVEKVDEKEEILTIQQLAEFLHCSEATVYSHRIRGWLPTPYQVGRKIIWRKSEIMEFLKTPINKRKKTA